MHSVQLLVLAKEPLPGRVKTRLSPPLSSAQSAAVARASLEDTLDVVRGTDVAARVLVVDGAVTAPGFSVQRQAGGSLDERLAAAFADAWRARQLPVLLVGMDTPQVDVPLLDAAVVALLAPGVDAVIGLAVDGGWWALGMRKPRSDLVRGVRTSRDDTGAVQRGRLVDAGLSVVDLPVLTDVDTAADLRPVASLAPEGRFADAVRQVLA